MWLKIATLCGCGLGTSFLLKFTAEKAVKELGIEARVFPGSMDRYGMEKADLYLFPYGLSTDTAHRKEAMAPIHNVLDVEEVKQAILEALRRGCGK